ncbi:unnamed protein product [Darwinula stevensoni]|uniref:Nuclear receptor domain-containing protein n=1 Tax=Darwinula stevensoni TaxID=69355 RepID=A0A7R9A520_9CRUS|nr:unnamed protein product [Darwinula stevensoni]CAG0884603.1 unnamed protein product [Darwinula stevensoni]
MPHSFFGRTYNNLSSINECKNSGRCVINKKNRTSCKACRLRKCLMVGMSKQGSRYGRRSNWFKIHCLLQEQTGASLEHPPVTKDLNKDVSDYSKELSSPESHASDNSGEFHFSNRVGGHVTQHSHLDSLPLSPPLGVVAASMGQPFFDRNLFPGLGPLSPLAIGGLPPLSLPSFPAPPRVLLGPLPPTTNPAFLIARRTYLDAVLGRQRLGGMRFESHGPGPETGLSPPEPISGQVPEQETPIDLTVRKGGIGGGRNKFEVNCSAKSPGSAENEDCSDGAGSASDVEDPDSPGTGRSSPASPENDDETRHRREEPSTPLDLTTRSG